MPNNRGLAMSPVMTGFIKALSHVCVCVFVCVCVCVCQTNYPVLYSIQSHLLLPPIIVQQTVEGGDLYFHLSYLSMFMSLSQLELELLIMTILIETLLIFLIIFCLSVWKQPETGQVMWEKEWKMCNKCPWLDLNQENVYYLWLEHL